MRKNYKLQFTRIKKGFTLIELMVVISIIGILAAMVMVSFTSAQKQARDTQRKSDLKQYQTLLEQYANLKNGFYPSYIADNKSADTLCSAFNAVLNINVTCPTDPKNGTSPYGYYYQSDGNGNGTVTATKYLLYAYLENTGSYLVVCSNGMNTTSLSRPTITNYCQ